MKYIIVVILLILSACALFLALEKYVCNKSKNFLTAYTKNYKKYEKILISNCTDLNIKVYDIFPDILKKDDKNCVAKSSADMRKFFISIGYQIDDFSFNLNKLSLIDSNLYEDFDNYFRNLKMISFNNGKPFREEDLES